MSNALAHLIAATANGGANGCQHMGRIAAKFLRHGCHGLGRYGFHRALPAAMCQPHRLIYWISQQDRRAVCKKQHQRQSRLVGNQGIRIGNCP